MLTLHRCINYGSYWQARCLVEGLRGRGCEAVLLDHRAPRAERAEWRCALSPSLPARTPRSDFPAYAAKARKFFEQLAALPLSAPFNLDDPAAGPACDTVVVGSDEVWNLHHPWYAGYPAFFGENLRAARVVAYAASFGNHDAGGRLDAPWADRLGRFDLIGVRDENSRQLIQRALEVDPPVVLDPCLQFPDICARAPSAEPPADVVVYGHSFPEWFATAARAWAFAAGRRLVSIGYRNDWADEQQLDAGPDAFAQAMGNAAAVLTNFFHGCVFALVNDKPFAAALSPYRVNKLTGLARLVGAEHRLIDAASPATFARLLETPLEAEISCRIAIIRRRSTAYLDHALA